MGEGGAGLDFFISCASGNRVWAEWIAVELERAGFSTRYQAADFRAGRDFVHEMQVGVVDADRVGLEVSTSTVCRSVLTPPGPGGQPSVGGS